MKSEAQIKEAIRLLEGMDEHARYGRVDEDVFVVVEGAKAALDWVIEGTTECAHMFGGALAGLERERKDAARRGN